MKANFQILFLLYSITISQKIDFLKRKKLVISFFCSQNSSQIDISKVKVNTGFAKDYYGQIYQFILVKIIVK